MIAPTPIEPTPFVATRPGTGGRATGPTPVRRQAVGFGPLTALVQDPLVTDVFVNGATAGGGELWADRGAGLAREPPLDLDDIQLRDFAVGLIAQGGRHIDEATPCVDVRLHDGIRVHVVLPPVSSAGTLISIRLARIESFDLTSLDAAGFFGDFAVATVAGLVSSRENLLITGAAGSGKTTLLAAMLSAAKPSDRIIAIEDVAELHPTHPHFVSLEARQANLEGAGSIDVGRLVREALRMRPDRLVIGECRGAEIRELLGALNTGHDGGAGTLHANSLADVPARIEALGALAGLDATSIARQAASAIGTVLHLERTPNGRRLTQLGHFALDSRDRLTID